MRDQLHNAQPEDIQMVLDETRFLGHGRLRAPLALEGAVSHQIQDAIPHVDAELASPDRRITPARSSCISSSRATGTGSADGPHAQRHVGPML
jgi:hypothetical protein